MCNTGSSACSQLPLTQRTPTSDSTISWDNTKKGIFITFQYRHSPNNFITIAVDNVNPKDENTQKRVKGLFYRMLPGFRNIVAFWKVPRLRPFDLLVRDAHSTLVEWYIQGKTGQKTVPVSLCQLKITRGLNWHRTRASVARGRRVTAWAMARPADEHRFNPHYIQPQVLPHREHRKINQLFLQRIPVGLCVRITRNT
jgi:hypothetical protein